MNIKVLVTLASIIAMSTANAQNQESADSLNRELQEIVFTAKQPATRLEGSTLVSTIAGSNLSNLGNALDVLAQLPMIKVDDSTVSVVGRSNTEIYIDGRPMRDNMELQQLLSGNIKRVELLMAPGARYSSTTDAVIKITTRRDFLQGLSVTDQFTLKRRRKWSLVDLADLNYRAGAYDFFLSGAFNHDNTVVNGSTVNTLKYNGETTTVGSSQNNRYPTNTGSVKGGLNYSKDTLSFGAYYSFSPERGKFSNTGTEWLNDQSPVSRIINRDVRGRSHYVSMYYDNTFSDRYLLHFDGDFRSSAVDNQVDVTYPATTDAAVNSADHRRSTLWAGKLCLDFPLAHGDFTVGTQATYTRTKLDYMMLNQDVESYIPSSFTDARQASAAAFASWRRTFNRLSMSLGLRYEYVDYDFSVDGKRDNDVSRRDNLLTPDLSLSYTFNDRAQVSLSYKMATVKPSYSQLTGALNYVGLHEIEGGNPALRDERMHDVQLFAMCGDFMLQSSLTRSIDTYAFVKQLYPAHNLQLMMHPVNIDVSSVSLYLIWSRAVKFWTPNVTAGIYKQWLDIDGTCYNKPIMSYYFDNTFTLPHGWSITANISGQSQGDMHTNRFASSPFMMDASIGKTMLNRSLTLKLSATDLFNTANNNWTMNTFGVFVDKRQSYNQRGIALNVIYRFNPRQNKYKGRAANEEEMKRL